MLTIKLNSIYFKTKKLWNDKINTQMIRYISDNLAILFKVFREVTIANERDHLNYFLKDLNDIRSRLKQNL
jgi:hypothetical protein